MLCLYLHGIPCTGQVYRGQGATVCMSCACDTIQAQEKYKEYSNGNRNARDRWSHRQR
jgi:hypothetical protein